MPIRRRVQNLRPVPLRPRNLRPQPRIPLRPVAKLRSNLGLRPTVIPHPQAKPAPRGQFSGGNFTADAKSGAQARMAANNAARRQIIRRTYPTPRAQVQGYKRPLSPLGTPNVNPRYKTVPAVQSRLQYGPGPRGARGPVVNFPKSKAKLGTPQQWMRNNPLARATRAINARGIRGLGTPNANKRRFPALTPQLAAKTRKPIMSVRGRRVGGSIAATGSRLRPGKAGVGGNLRVGPRRSLGHSVPSSRSYKNPALHGLRPGRTLSSSHSYGSTKPKKGSIPPRKGKGSLGRVTTTRRGAGGRGGMDVNALMAMMGGGDPSAGGFQLPEMPDFAAMLNDMPETNPLYDSYAMPDFSDYRFNLPEFPDYTGRDPTSPDYIDANAYADASQEIPFDEAAYSSGSSSSSRLPKAPKEPKAPKAPKTPRLPRERSYGGRSYGGGGGRASSGGYGRSYGGGSGRSYGGGSGRTSYGAGSSGGGYGRAGGRVPGGSAPSSGGVGGNAVAANPGLAYYNTARTYTPTPTPAGGTVYHAPDLSNIAAQVAGFFGGSSPIIDYAKLRSRL